MPGLFIKFVPAEPQAAQSISDGSLHVFPAGYLDLVNPLTLDHSDWTSYAEYIDPLTGVS